MPLPIAANAPTILVRRAAYEGSGITRATLDARFNLTADEFRVERGLVAIGPLSNEDDVGPFIEELERHGLIYFDDFFELSGNWPEWLSVHAGTEEP